MKETPTRRVEMIQLNPDRTWEDGIMVEIPANTHPSRIEEVARIHAAEQHGTAWYVLYHSMDDECPNVPIRSEMKVGLSFDLGQATVGSETEQQAAAIDAINLTLQREPHGLGAQIFMLDHDQA